MAAYKKKIIGHYSRLHHCHSTETRKNKAYVEDRKYRALAHQSLSVQENIYKNKKTLN